MVAEGKLALADPVEKWLPGKVPGGKAITVRMLLNHTSGLADYTADPAVVPSIVGKGPRGWTSAELLAVGVKHDPLFAPGTKWDYINANYAAIGAVLERVSGTGLADLVRDRIARPLYLAPSTRRTPLGAGGMFAGTSQTRSTCRRRAGGVQGLRRAAPRRSRRRLRQRPVVGRSGRGGGVDGAGLGAVPHGADVGQAAPRR
ncbi:serine hydrolase domain-containing protein [Allokutzneria oryzae]|uniref:Serine hydrolase domain-containing protein n=1 Tax=Allokutzneria oryzae TaxID=1378989 RepID=A0ABV5ZTN1_9PSEU